MTRVVLTVLLVSWAPIAAAQPDVSAPAVAAPEEDRVETIDQSPQDEAQPEPNITESVGGSSAAPTVPAESERHEQYALSGWARQSFELMLADVGGGAPELTVPYDRVISRTQGFLRFKYSRERWFELNMSGALSYGYFLQGHGGSLGSDAESYSVRGSLEPRLQELYVGFFTPDVDIRVGQQRVAWGRADTQSPNDILNAYDMRDPLTPETDLAHIPTPLIRVDWYFGDVSLQGIVAPVFVPDVLDVYGSNWALLQPDAPRELRGFFRLMSSMVDTSQHDAFNRLIQHTEQPDPAAENVSAGGKLAATLGSVDVDVYYFYGFDSTPLLKLDSALIEQLKDVNFATATVANFDVLFTSFQLGYPLLTIEYVRRHHVGFDAATVLGPLGLRLDAAYDTARVFFRRDLSGIASRTLQTVASIEYQTGDLRRVFLIEGSVLQLLDVESEDLLLVEETSITAAALVRFPVLTSFDVELRAMLGVLPRSVLLRPQLGHRFSESFSVYAGGVWLSGANWSLGEYFGRNVEGYLAAKYAF